MATIIDDAAVRILPDFSGFRADFDAKIREAMRDAGQSVRVRVDVDSATLRAELRARLAEASRGLTIRVPVVLDVAAFNAQAALIQARLDRLHAGPIGPTPSPGGGGGGGGGGAGGGGLLLPGIISGASLVGPLSAAATGALAGLTAATATAGLAFAGLKAQWQLGIGQGGQLRDTVTGIKGELSKLSQVAAGAAGPGLNSMFAGFKAELPTLAPLVKTFGDALGKASNYIGQGLVSGLNAAKPLLKDFAGYIVAGARSFAEFAKSDTFKQFLDYARQELPKIGTLLKNLVTGAVALFKGLQPLGDAIIGITTAVSPVLKLLGSFPQLTSSIAAGFLVWRLAVLAAAAANVTLEASLGPVGLALAAGAALVAVFSGGTNKAKLEITDFTQALKDDSGALGANTRALAFNTLEKDGAYKAGLKLGISQKTLTDAALGDKAAVAEVNAAVKAHMGNIGEYGSAIATVAGSVAGVTASIKDSTQANKDETTVLGQKTTALDQQTASYTGLKKAMAEALTTANVFHQGKIVANTPLDLGAALTAETGALQPVTDALNTYQASVLAVGAARTNLSAVIHSTSEADTSAEHALTEARQNTIDTEIAGNLAIRTARAAVVLAEQDAAKQIRTARAGVTQAVRDAAAAERTAEQGVVDAQKAALQAQKALTQARKDAVREIQDARNALRDMGNSEEAARIQLEKDQLAEAGRTGALTPEQILAKYNELQARGNKLQLSQDVNNLADVRLTNSRTKVDAGAVVKAGVSGNVGVLSAQQSSAAANKAVVASERQLRQTRIDNAAAVGKAEANLRDVTVASQRAVAAAIQNESAAEVAARKNNAGALYAEKQAQQSYTDTVNAGRKSRDDAHKAITDATKARDADKTALDLQAAAMGLTTKQTRALSDAVTKANKDYALTFSADPTAARKAINDVKRDLDVILLEAGGAAAGDANRQAALDYPNAKAAVTKTHLNTPSVKYSAAGGPIQGVGGPTEDNIPVMASAGEFMQPVHAVQHYGREFMEAIRTHALPRFAEGGPVQVLDKINLGRMGLAAKIRATIKDALAGNIGPIGLGPTPLGYATAIVDIANTLKLGRKGAEIGLETGLVESGLRNLANSKIPGSLTLPHDGVGSNGYSMGLMQQQGGPFGNYWGSVKQIMTPNYAILRFFHEMLRKVPDWRAMRSGAVAQAVQSSGNPGAYDLRQGQANQLLALVGSGGGGTLGGGIGGKWKPAGGFNVMPGHDTPPWPAPVHGVISANAAALIRFSKSRFGLTDVNADPGRVDPFDHPWGKAVDNMIPNYSTPAGIAKGWEVANYYAANPHQFGTKYILWRDKQDDGSGWSGPGVSGHFNHVHVSLLDKGGLLQPGASVVMNKTRKPEAVLTNEQWGQIAAIATRGGGGGGHMTMQHVDTQIIQTPVDADLVARSLEFAYRAGSH